MVVSHFLKWISTAKVSQRASAAAALARAFVDGELPFEDRCAAEAALTFLLDDPSARVRQAMAEVLAPSLHAPAQIVGALASDQPEVAAYVLARSPLLTDADLIDRIAGGQRATQKLIAGRPAVSLAVSAAIAEIGEAEAIAVLAGNDGAHIAEVSFRRMVDRHGHVPAVREALAAHRQLPPDCRHLLLTKLGEALQGAPLVVALIGSVRAQRVVRDACARSSLTVIDGTAPREHPALVEHMRLRGELTPGFIVRALAHGKVDFFGSVLVTLAGQAESRVRALLAAGSDMALSALLRKSGLADVTHRVILRALKVWREVANGRRVAGTQEVAWLMLKELGGSGEEAPLVTLLKSIHLEALRDNARGHALAIAAA